MLLTKVVKYKILEYCIDNFFDILSTNLHISDKTKPYNVKIFVKPVDDDNWVPRICVEISGRDFEYFENRISFESVQDIMFSVGPDMGIDSILEFLLVGFIRDNIETIDRDVLVNIISNVRRNLYQIIMKH